MSRAQQRRPAVARDSAVGSGERVDDDGCPILHVDMDAFFAMVEIRTRPDLVGRPVIVGGGDRGVVLSATYEARSHGVHSAMSMARARRLCPAAIVVPPHHEEYARVSADVFSIFETYTPLVEPLSIDEAFLDVAGAHRTGGRPAQIGAAIRGEVSRRLGVTCSVGVAATKFVAKLASTLIKPDGLLVVPSAHTLSFLLPLPVGSLWGVGETTERALAAFGLRTVGDVHAAPERLLIAAVGRSVALHLQALSRGHDPRPVTPSHSEKSIGCDETFAADTTDRAVLDRELRRLAERVTRRVRAAGVVGRTVTLRVRYADFTTITRSRTLREPTSSGYAVFGVAGELLDALHPLPAPIRLLGIRIEALSSRGGDRQLALDDSASEWDTVDVATDRAASRFGAGSVRPARLVAPPASDRDLRNRRLPPTSRRAYP